MTNSAIMKRLRAMDDWRLSKTIAELARLSTKIAVKDARCAGSGCSAAYGMPNWAWSNAFETLAGYENDDWLSQWLS